MFPDYLSFLVFTLYGYLRVCISPFLPFFSFLFLIPFLDSSFTCFHPPVQASCPPGLSLTHPTHSLPSFRTILSPPSSSFPYLPFAFPPFPSSLIFFIPYLSAPFAICLLVYFCISSSFCPLILPFPLPSFFLFFSYLLYFIRCLHSAFFLSSSFLMYYSFFQFFFLSLSFSLLL